MSFSETTNLPSKGREIARRVKYSLPTVGASTMIAGSLLLKSFAAGDSSELESTITGIFGGIYGLISGIATAAAAILVVCALVFIGVSKDEKKGAVAISWIKRILICWACIVLIGPIITWVKSMIGEGTGSDLFGGAAASSEAR